MTGRLLTEDYMMNQPSVFFLVAWSIIGWTVTAIIPDNVSWPRKMKTAIMIETVGLLFLSGHRIGDELS